MKELKGKHGNALKSLKDTYTPKVKYLENNLKNKNKSNIKLEEKVKVIQQKTTDIYSHHIMENIHTSFSMWSASCFPRPIISNQVKTKIWTITCFTQNIYICEVGGQGPNRSLWLPGVCFAHWAAHTKMNAQPKYAKIHAQAIMWNVTLTITNSLSVGKNTIPSDNLRTQFQKPNIAK